MDYYFSVFPGSPVPLGATIVPQGINFAIFSRHATHVTVVVSWRIPGQGASPLLTEEIPLHDRLNKTGDIWHVLLKGEYEDLRYGFRIGGPAGAGQEGLFYDEKLVLLDPYAKALLPFSWGEREESRTTRPRCLVDDGCYDWEGDRPLNTPLKDSVIYELHVRGFTRHTSSKVEHGGGFGGIVEKIDYLKELGVTAVELMPVTEFDENDNIFKNPLTGEQLKNYWGYSPLSFFAPKSAYAKRGENVLHEFRDMVKALHRAGIEVILDIVYNHTSEGGYDGNTVCFRGIDNPIYYLLDPWTKAYLNYSGCGNTCNCNHPIMRTLIMDALRWWVVEMHVDGFRFDLASILGRDQKGEVLANPPVVEQIAEDPILSGSKIIAEAWDAAGLYQVGSFSTHRRWAEWNGRFRDDVRSFMAGQSGSTAALATRIAGSSDLYQHSDRRPCNSINFLTSHDGFTLWDLVSYDRKYNLENGEGNRDGDNHNLSWNSGVEGETTHPEILALRYRRIRTMAVILFLSQGVPMLCAGDELGRTQLGNNNAYCQDNEISWLDWRLFEKNGSLFRFFQKLIRLRKDHPVFRRDDFFAVQNPEDEPLHLHEIVWHGLRPGRPDWSPESKTLAFTLNGSVPPFLEDDDFYVMLNGHRETRVDFTIAPPPVLHGRRVWKKIIDTTKDSPYDIVEHDQGVPVTSGSELELGPMGCIVLQSRQ